MSGPPPDKFAKCMHCQAILYASTEDCIVCVANPWQICGNLVCGRLPPVKHNPVPKKIPGQSSINKNLWIGHGEHQEKKRQRNAKKKGGDAEEVKETADDPTDANEEVCVFGDMDP
ncbi:hypothetical protein GGTG_12910 [Gaeumannomyces tritici R3-111a-1]|uniref:Uncharacterized protein n=1 Tax=Gaeumannomyces tritici (strain R3-111a-1) TaxID=644352 RepID=J3PHD1_GAET3|nr:hypothetical protein GGTG_12910 [Gaeumannomyces tritici R3-111a-1]EJT69291.1 hypothetical protein GGTG_12910 [Gaeumannomyces tritici R3-111a-1]